MIEMIVLLLAAIFFFAVATLFRSNEALDRVGEVEKELKNVEEHIEKNQSSAPTSQSQPIATTPSTPEFPNPQNIRMD